MRKDFKVTASRGSSVAQLDRVVRSSGTVRVSCYARFPFAFPFLSVILAIDFMAFGASAWSDADAHGGEIRNWVFSGGLEGGLYFDSAEASADGTPLVGPRATNIDFVSDDVSTVIRSIDDSNDVRSGLLGPNLEVMSPAPFDIATHPRFFMDFSALAAITQETSIVRSGDPGEYAIPLPITRSAPFVGERAISGTGTVVSSQHQGVQLHMGIGTAFTFDIGEQRLRIKPSLRYSRTETKITATTRRAVRIVNADPFGPNPGDGRIRSLDSYRFVSLDDSFTEVFHSIGPALEIEYDTAVRVGPFETTLFMKGGANHLFGDLETEFLKSNPDYPAESVSYKYENEPWTYQVSTGFRLRFALKSKR